ncbi:histidinol-phosphate transaminase [Methylomonas sp. AM2-LC]|uniref:histidinol-phosphate transaminase n=1 Tax=Methylomonas sp. AM2-LC TaxID=3153301 RepID=UPI0032646041
MSEFSISKLFRSELLSMSAYKVADAKNLIKLDAMENPYTWPENIQQQWLQTLKSCDINRYPDPEARRLSAALRSSNEISAQSEILLGNGSDEIIQILLMSLPANAIVLAPEPGFVMYKQVAHSLGLQFKGVPVVADDFSLDLPAMLLAISELQPSLIFLAYPNNPTGNLFDAEAIKQIIFAAPGLVVVDEAYAPFANASFLSEIGKYKNLLIMRTLSKLGLAGLRLGFLIGHPDLLVQLNKIRLPYNINSLTQITATFALNNGSFLLEQTQTLCAERALVFKALEALADIKPYPSAANFILFRSLRITANQLFDALKLQGILIKNLSSQGGILENCLRVTIGTPDENQIFLKAMQNILQTT